MSRTSCDHARQTARYQQLNRVFAAYLWVACRSLCAFVFFEKKKKIHKNFYHVVEIQSRWSCPPSMSPGSGNDREKRRLFLRLRIFSASTANVVVILRFAKRERKNKCANLFTDDYNYRWFLFCWSWVKSPKKYFKRKNIGWFSL